MKDLIYSVLITLGRAVHALLTGIILLLCIGFLAQFVDDVSRYSVLHFIVQMETRFFGPLIEWMRHAVPTRFSGVDFSHLFVAVLFMVLSGTLTRFTDNLYTTRERQRLDRDYTAWRDTYGARLSKEKLQEIDSRFRGLQKASGKDRKDLLEAFINIKEQLDAMGQQLAFLAMDVVDSTGMKRDEDKHVASWDFERYNLMVSNCLQQNGVVKLAMTPDGIMSCFRTVDDAVRAAQCVLSSLETFNRTERKIKTPFQVRFGINAGFVYIDEETPLEQVSDRVIDIAGHMQKHARPDSINIAASAIEPLKMRGGFHETTDVIDEQRVYVWSRAGAGVAIDARDGAK